MPKTVIPNGGPNDRAVLQGMYLVPGVVGDLRYVSSVTGSATGPGWAPENAYATLIQAQTVSTASQGDVVLVGPAHAESVIGAAGMTFSKAGITYVGLGLGRNRPTITFSTAIGAQIIVSGANITFKNMIFDFTGFDAITAAISVTGADVSFEDCEFIVNSATAGVVLGILTAATAARLRVVRCRFTGPPVNAGTTVTACIKHEVGVDYEISGCFFRGKMTQAILNATAVLGGLIADNRFHVGTGTEAITLHASSTPFIVNNDMCVASGTAPIIAAAASFSNNHYTTESNGPTAGTALAF